MGRLDRTSMAYSNRVASSVDSFKSERVPVNLSLCDNLKEVEKVIIRNRSNLGTCKNEIRKEKKLEHKPSKIEKI